MNSKDIVEWHFEQLKGNNADIATEGGAAEVILGVAFGDGSLDEEGQEERINFGVLTEAKATTQAQFITALFSQQPLISKAAIVMALVRMLGNNVAPLFSTILGQMGMGKVEEDLKEELDRIVKSAADAGDIADSGEEDCFRRNNSILFRKF